MNMLNYKLRNHVLPRSQSRSFSDINIIQIVLAIFTASVLNACDDVNPEISVEEALLEASFFH